MYNMYYRMINDYVNDEPDVIYTRDRFIEYAKENDLFRLIGSQGQLNSYWGRIMTNMGFIPMHDRISLPENEMRPKNLRFYIRPKKGETDSIVTEGIFAISKKLKIKLKKHLKNEGISFELFIKNIIGDDEKASINSNEFTIPFDPNHVSPMERFRRGEI